MGKIVLETEGLFTVNEACKIIGIGYSTIYRWIKRQLIIPVKIDGQNFIPQGEILKGQLLKDKKDKQAVVGGTTA